MTEDSNNRDLLELFIHDTSLMHTCSGHSSCICKDCCNTFIIAESNNHMSQLPEDQKSHPSTLRPPTPSSSQPQKNHNPPTDLQNGSSVPQPSLSNMASQYMCCQQMVPNIVPLLPETNLAQQGVKLSSWKQSLRSPRAISDRIYNEGINQCLINLARDCAIFIPEGFSFSKKKSGDMTKKGLIREVRGWIQNIKKEREECCESEHRVQVLLEEFRLENEKLKSEIAKIKAGSETESKIFLS